MLLLVDAVEKKITTKASVMPCSALIFDGWSEDSVHFIGLFITLTAKDAKAMAPFSEIYLLAFAPLLDETTFTAANHRDFIVATLEWYHLPVSNLICLIGDNCNTNCATADLVGVPLLGCHSHRLNLAVEAYIDKYLETEIDLVTNCQH
jgi:hypothetical protein